MTKDLLKKDLGTAREWSANKLFHSESELAVPCVKLT